MAVFYPTRHRIVTRAYKLVVGSKYPSRGCIECVCVFGGGVKCPADRRASVCIDRMGHRHVCSFPESCTQVSDRKRCRARSSAPKLANAPSLTPSWMLLNYIYQTGGLGVKNTQNCRYLEPSWELPPYGKAPPAMTGLGGGRAVSQSSVGTKGRLPWVGCHAGTRSMTKHRSHGQKTTVRPYTSAAGPPAKTPTVWSKGPTAPGQHLLTQAHTNGSTEKPSTPALATHPHKRKTAPPMLGPAVG